MRLIDADALKENVSRTALTITGMRFGKTVLREILIKYRDCVLRTIDEAPTIDAEPVKHGRWLKTDKGTAKNINTGEMMRIYSHDCSICGWHTGNQGGRFNYCPNCGAKMDGGNDE